MWLVVISAHEWDLAGLVDFYHVNPALDHLMELHRVEVGRCFSDMNLKLAGAEHG